MKFLFLSLLIVCSAGCSSIPFEPEPYADYSDVDPVKAIGDFEVRSCRQFEQVQSVLFEFIGHKVAGMGALSVNRNEGTFALSCMSLTGMKILEFSGDRDSVDISFAIPVFKGRESEVVTAIADDIRHIYFNTVPEDYSDVEHDESTLEFIKEGDEEIRHIFAGEAVNLVEKKVDVGWFTSGSEMYYFNYKTFGGFDFPTVIVLDNNKYHYRLTIKAKSVTVVSDNVNKGN